MRKITGALLMLAIVLSFFVVNSLLAVEEDKWGQKALSVQKKINTQTQASSSETGVDKATTPSAAVRSYSPVKKFEKPPEIGTVRIGARGMEDVHWVYVNARKFEGTGGRWDGLEFINSTNHILPQGLRIYYMIYYEQEGLPIRPPDDGRHRLTKDLQPGESETVAIPTGIREISRPHYLTNEYEELMG